MKIRELRRAIGLALVWTLGLGASRCPAAQLRPLTPEDLAGRAEVVVQARVEAIETVKEAKGQVTRIELAVVEVWKGAVTNRLVLVQPGGILGTRKVVVTGDADFALGEELVLFAVRNGAGEWLTLELAQGKFQIERPAAGEALVRNLFFGGDRSPGGFRPKNQLPLTLSALRERVREVTR